MRIGHLPTVLRLAAATLVFGSVLSCALVMSFDRFDQGLFSVGGDVDGLEGSATVRLVLNGGQRSLDVGNGHFTFATAAGDGPYAVTVEATGYACSLERGQGVVAGASVTDVAVHCSSSDATLQALSISAAPLAPVFEPATLGYSAGPLRTEAIFSPTTTTVTAVTRSPSAHITVQGTPAGSGMPSAPVALVGSPQPIDVTVTAADGKTQVHYAIVVSTTLYDYVKASNTRAQAGFGGSIAIAGDLLAVGSPGESSSATTVNGNEADTSAPNAGAVYLYARSNGLWMKQSYIKASNARAQAFFGSSVALSQDGQTLVVAASGDSSNATTINGNGSDTSMPNAGAVYVYFPHPRIPNEWLQAAYIKASNTRANAFFGGSIALSGDTLAVGAIGESSAAKLVNGNGADTSAPSAGAAYIYKRSSGGWAQEAYIKASNTSAGAEFGSVALSGDTLAVGAMLESSNATLVNGNETDTSMPESGAVYVYTRTAGVWTKQAYVKASNTRAGALFGCALALSGDTLAVGSFGESSAATGINGKEADASAPYAGAVYVYGRTAGVWAKQAYIKASNVRTGAPGVQFGRALALSQAALVVGAGADPSGARLIGGDVNDVSAPGSGAAYVFTQAASSWTQLAYVKASNTRARMFFGASVALSASNVVVGATGESSSATLLNGNQNDTNAANAGAVYVY
jgi:hypothetical protein